MNDRINYKPITVAERIVNYTISSGKKFLFLSGNGGSGKTELSKIISSVANKHGHVNVLDMDDFVVDTKLRNSATITWIDKEKGQQSGRYTTSFAESYFLQNVKAIIYNIEMGNNYYHWPKKAIEQKECRLLYGNAIITIIEGPGTVYLNKNENKYTSIFMECSKEIEINRRINRGRFSNEQNADDVNKKYDERNSQYKANIEPHKNEFGIVLDSLEDYSLNVVRDNYNILL